MGFQPKAVERASLPFQVVETINESRATRETYQAEQKVRGHVEPERRVLAYLASGKYGALLPEARWVN